MDRRKLVAGLVVLAAGLLMMAGTASAHNAVLPAATEAEPGACHIQTLPSFVAQGEFSESATVADIIEVSCDPESYSAGAEVTIVAAQLYSLCHEVTWYDPNNQNEGFTTGDGRSFRVKLDVDGNANVGLIAGPNCHVGETLISVDENESPYETFTRAFKVAAATDTPQGVRLEPATQVEDAYSSGVITIAEVEFPGESEKYVRVGFGQLYDRCEVGPKVHVIGEDRYDTADEYAAEDTSWDNDGEVTNAIQLDNNGNGFVLLAGDSSCRPGTSLIEADLEASPFTTETGEFTIESPRPSRF
jgi:hypothetical protein